MSLEQLQDKVEQIPGVERADVDGAGVEIVLEDGISVDDAVATMVAVRDEMFDNHRRESEATLQVFVHLEPSPDSENRFPKQIYGEWSGGISSQPKFEQQAAFLASFASGPTLTEGPADLAYIALEILGDPFPAQIKIEQWGENDPADMDAVVAELQQRWVDSGGNLDDLRIRGQD